MIFFALLVGIWAQLDYSLANIQVPDEIKDKYYIICAKAIQDMYDMSFKFKCEYRDKLNEVMIEHGINNIWREVFFLAFMGAHSNGWKMYEEQTDGSTYATMTEIGNLGGDDGEHFKMRGAGIWLFGRDDYVAFEEYIGNPNIFQISDYHKISSDFKLAITASAWKWKRLGLNTISDHAFDRSDYLAVIHTVDEIKEVIRERYHGQMKEYSIESSVFKQSDLQNVIKCSATDINCGTMPLPTGRGHSGLTGGRLSINKGTLEHPGIFAGTSKAAYYQVFMSLFSTCNSPHPNWQAAVDNYNRQFGERRSGDSPDPAEAVPHCYVSEVDPWCSLVCDDPAEEEQCLDL